MKDQHSTSEDEHWHLIGLTPKPGGNPPPIPPDYLYDPDGDVYWNPRNPNRFMQEPKPIEKPPDLPPEAYWNPELQAWFVPGVERTVDLEAWHRDYLKLVEEGRDEPPIPPEQLKVPPGTLDVPPAWRKSLGGEDRDLFSDLPEDDQHSENQEPASGKSDSSEEARRS